MRAGVFRFTGRRTLLGCVVVLGCVLVVATGACTAKTSTRSPQIVELSTPSVANVGETVVEGPIKTGKGTPRVGTFDFDGKVFNCSIFYNIYIYPIIFCYFFMLIWFNIVN